MDKAVIVVAAFCALCCCSSASEPLIQPKIPLKPFFDNITPPEVFPKEGVFKQASEVPDLLSTPPPDTDTVSHPNVVDPGTTHEEGVASNTIHICTFPHAWLKASNANDSQDWMSDDEDTANNTCIPRDWLRNSSSDSSIHICSMPREWLQNSNYTIQNGTIPRDWLRNTNSTANCITPSDEDDDNGTIANATIPSAWLRDSNDNIYIYFIPRDWLKYMNESDEVKIQNNNVTTMGNVSTSNSSLNTNVTGTNTTAISNKTTEDNSSSLNISSIPANKNATSKNDTESGNGTSPVPTDISTPPSASNETNTTVIKVVNNTSEPAVVSQNTTENVTAAPAEPIDKGNKPSEEATTTKAPEKLITEPPTKVPEVTKEATTKKEEKVEEDNKTAVPQKGTSNPNDVSFPPEIPNNDLGNGEDTSLSPSPVALSQQHADHSHASSGKTAFLQPTESAAILAGVFVGIALLGYVGLLVWRRILERRYGNREMLVNEDDDFDTNDMRHFEL